MTRYIQRKKIKKFTCFFLCSVCLSLFLKYFYYVSYVYLVSFVYLVSYIHSVSYVQSVNYVYLVSFVYSVSYIYTYSELCLFGELCLFCEVCLLCELCPPLQPYSHKWISVIKSLLQNNVRFSSVCQQMGTLAPIGPRCIWMFVIMIWHADVNARA